MRCPGAGPDFLLAVPFRGAENERLSEHYSYFRFFVDALPWP